MFTKLVYTNSRPAKPTLVWDGNCGFCKYWVIRWMRLSNQKTDFIPLQRAVFQFTDIEEQYFKEAARLIDVDGQIYNGPAAAYKSLALAGKYSYLLNWYERNAGFRKLSDIGYQFIADNRNSAMDLTHHLFGDNPINLKPYWVFYLMMVVALILLLL
jgi:predicted DCC family thiol-disulfide oxidoreductase YuxK